MDFWHAGRRFVLVLSNALAAAVHAAHWLLPHYSHPIGEIILKSIHSIALFAALALSSGAFAGVQTATLDVPGMTCASCPITVKKALMKVDGVQQVKASFEKREAVVTFDDSKVSVEKLSLASANAGYPATVKASK
ncbi:mercury resistance system periplasmic binding protein MerP [Noviherbaspirillum album]|jgi:mercuric ion binding protein|uniref:mercury resistance system periplasmic binding protein MerP n=1 Tax=Noviherbaspirillum album TaxID=3080276 RepID=UPI003F58B868